MSLLVFIIVNGPPCSGKTTLATFISRELNFPCFHKDKIKESLYEQLEKQSSAVSLKHELGLASYNLLFLIAEELLLLGYSVIIEGNFYPQYQKNAFLKLITDFNPLVIEVYCKTEPDILKSRFLEREESGIRHPAHRNHTEWNQEELNNLHRKNLPLNLGGVQIVLDTTNFSRVYPSKILEQIQSIIEKNG